MGRYVGTSERKRATIQVWGTRGSVPICGESFRRHGGSTTCFVIETEAHRVIIDAGTGLSAFAREGAPTTKDTTLFLSHYHQDHLMGFPFYAPIYEPGWTCTFAAVTRSGLTGLQALLATHRQPYFPVPLPQAMNVTTVDRTLDATGACVLDGVHVAWMDVPHPGGASAFRVTTADCSVVIATDVELSLLPDDAFLRFSEGADAAFLDAQYRPEEYEKHRGWGHSTHLDAARFAVSAGIAHLYLTHHDARRTDDAIDAMVEEARAVHPRVAAAYDRQWLAGPDKV